METSDGIEQTESAKTLPENERGVAVEDLKSEIADEVAANQDHSELPEVVTETVPNDEETKEGSPQATERVEARSRDSISLQRVASVEEISRAMAKAEKSRPRRKRQESETMQNWKKEFEERLKKKDELESEAIKQLRVQADNEKSQWYEQWKQEVAERREQNFRDQEEASDQVDEDVWMKMSRLAKSLNTRKNSQDLNRMKAFSSFLDKLPRNHGSVPQTL